ncbi:MAG: hypothetical protein WDM90_01285 [Ferruginibacter sp.]
MVLTNCGLQNQFTPGAEVYIRFTCKEKLPNDKRIIEKPEDFKRGDDIEKGIVKWLVEFFDETDEITGVATILTMVKKKKSITYTKIFYDRGLCKEPY